MEREDGLAETNDASDVSRELAMPVSLYVGEIKPLKGSLKRSGPGGLPGPLAFC
jgi:hypothetical protein